MTTTTDTTPKIYVGTYAKYNNGSIEGAWLDLSDFSSKEDFYEACADLHKDEADPEFMFQDWENIPSDFIGESWLSDEFFEIAEFLTALERFDADELVQAHNTACQVLRHDADEIYEFDDEFFDTFFEGKPMEAARATHFGTLNWSDDYIQFNGYGNLESISKHAIESQIDKDRIIEAYKSDASAFSHLV